MPERRKYNVARYLLLQNFLRPLSLDVYDCLSYNFIDFDFAVHSVVKIYAVKRYKT